MITMANQRFYIPDILKGIAVLLMIQVHITELFAQEAFYNGIAGKVSLFLGGVPAAPLFMAIMGFFAGYQTLKLHTNLIRGIKLIVLGFLLNIGLNLHLFYRIFKGIYTLDPLPYIFGADILFLAGISLIIIALIKRVSNSILLFVSASIAIALLSDLIPIYEGDSFFIRYPLAFIHSSDWWSYFPLIPWLAYPLIGVAAGIAYKKSSQEVILIAKKPVIIVALIIPFILFMKYGFSVSSELIKYYHHGIAFFTWAVIFLLLIVLALFQLSNYWGTNSLVGKYLQWTGKSVTAFYFIQWLLIGNLATALYKTQQLSILPVWYIGIVMSTSLLVLGWSYRIQIKKYFSS
jgi:uncharacterized membrane protein